jgi:DNA-binding transcriptional LysR family regulator
MLDVKRLRILREVSTQGSFSAAAETLYLSQSAVSQQVATFEREVGMSLLERTSDGPKLTAAGEALVGHADAVICRLEEAERELAAIAGLEGGSVRLGSFPSASATLATRAVSLFREQHPGVELTLTDAEPEDSVPALRRGDLDIALTFDYPDVPLDPGRDLEQTLLLTESMHLALPESHKLATGRAVRIADLAEEAWLAGSCPSSCSDLVKHAARDAGFEPQIGFESNDYNVIQGLIAGGLGVTLLPDLALASLRPGVVIAPVVPKAPQRRVFAATRAAGARSPATEAMLEILTGVGSEFAAQAQRAVAA